MEFFLRAKAVRLKSHDKTYLIAREGRERVMIDEDGSKQIAEWAVEFNSSKTHIRLKNCFGQYLTALDEKLYLFGWTGNKVTQTLPTSDTIINTTFWKPLRSGSKVQLESCWEDFLKGDGGIYPWKGNVTHTIPMDPGTILWEVEILELLPVPTPGRSASTSSGNDFDDIRAVALAYYANCSNDYKAAIHKLFLEADSDENGSLSYDEFKTACVKLNCNKDIDFMFRNIDQNNNGRIEFEEVKTFYYMHEHRMHFCGGCERYLNMSYFSCIKCFDEKKSKPFNLCATCLEKRKFTHEHKSELFMDNHALINYIGTEKSTVGILQWLSILKISWDVGTYVTGVSSLM